jgi:pimeloyl-ACP methyl ester carboxylesterase/uncharacterized protein YndB with AHSA1/START domain
MAEHKMKIRADKVTLNYRHEGEGKINIIFLHGWSIDSSYWKDQIDLLKDEYSVYAIDLPGYGDSKADERDAWSMEEFALDIRDFMKHLQLENIILVGHSMSGGIILDVAVKSSEEEIIALIGVDNLKTVGIEMAPDIKAQVDDYSAKLAGNYKEAVTTYAENYLFTPTTPDKVRERVVKDFAKTDPQIGLSTFRNLNEFSAKVPEKLQLIPQKLYLINSDSYPTNEHGLAKYCKNGYQVITMHGTGHYPMVEKPEEFNMLLKGLIDNIAEEFENELTARVSESVKAPIRKVWNALIDPEVIHKYMFGTKVESDWQVGSSIKWTGIWNGKAYEDKGTILAMDPPYTLKYSYYSKNSDLPDKPENYHTISYQLAEEGDHTLLLITQNNNLNKKQRDHSASNWKEMVKGLKEVLEG